MQLINHVINDVGPRQTHRFYFLADFHYPSVAHDAELAKATIDHIAKDKTAHVFLLGDLAECITIDDKRFDPASLIPAARLRLDDIHNFSLDYLVKLLKPIRRKIICAVTGNHEETLRKQHQYDLIERLRHELNKDTKTNIRHGGDIAAVRLLLRWYSNGKQRAPQSSQECVFLMSHGFGAGRTKGSKINRLMEMSYIMPECQGYFMAHHHDRLTDSFVTLGLVRKARELRLKEDKRLLGITGAFYRTYQENSPGNYASKRLYRPSDLGCIYAEVSPHHHTGTKPRQWEIRMDVRNLIL